ncbi:MAG: mandelate racemase/muconate lactonizing enzyme family protein [Cyclobacteriaceae bacterium]|nr:mandelate racemase/muconate lactonizing enzyme family protein [Cyclobacteriaceae bacterium]
MTVENSRRNFLKYSLAVPFLPELVKTGGHSGVISKDVPVKIKELEVTLHRNDPNPNPIRDAIQVLPGIGNVMVKVTSEDGISGTGSVYFGRIDGSLDALKSFIENVLKPQVLGTELGFIRGTYEAMIRETDYLGSKGFSSMAISAVDTALWDCLGKTLQVPCWKLWGACHTELPVYAMIGWINLDRESIKKRCEDALKLGYRAVKLKIGYPTLAEDLERIRYVREVIGDSTKLMIDANQVLTVGEAIERGKAFEDLNCYWFEEPIHAQNIEGYKQIASELKIQIAAGENLYSPQEFAFFIKQNAVDIIQPDLRRCGGPTALMDTGKMANAFGIPYASHGSDAAHFNVMACLPNVIMVETGGEYRLENGRKKIPEGWGFSWE